MSSKRDDISAMCRLADSGMDRTSNKDKESVSIPLVEIVAKGSEYVAFYRGTEVIRQKSIVKCSEKLYKYLKGQG